MNKAELSKFISFILRHKPETIIWQVGNVGESYSTDHWLFVATGKRYGYLVT